MGSVVLDSLVSVGLAADLIVLVGFVGCLVDFPLGRGCTGPAGLDSVPD